MNLLALIISIATFYAMHSTIENISNSSKYNKKFFYIGLVIFATIYTFLYINNYGLYGFLPVIYIAISTKIFLELNVKEWIFYVLAVYLIGVILDVLIMLVVSILIKHNVISSSCINSIQIGFSTVMLILYIFLSKSLKAKNIFQKLLKKILKINFPIVGLIILLIMYAIFDFICFLKINNPILLMFLTCITIMGFVIIIACIFHIYQVKSLKKTIEFLIKNNDAYAQVIDEYRILKHNIINQLLGIKSQMNKKSQLLIMDLIKEYKSTYKNINDIKDVPHGISGIIYEKIYNQEDVEKIKIKIDNKIIGDIFNKLTIRKYNSLCESLGIIIDNSLEHCIKSKKKILYMKLSETPEEINITIKNTFNGEIDIDKLGTKNYTSKNKGNGIGLFSIFRKKEIDLKTCIRENYFISTLLVEKIKKE